MKKVLEILAQDLLERGKTRFIGNLYGRKICFG